MTPAVYQRGGRGMRIGYALLDSPLGRMLVAGTERGLCAVYFGDSDAPLEADLMREYPQAMIEKHVFSVLSDWAAQVVAYLERRVSHAALAALPLDVQGTAFQAQVWRALQGIPEGQVRSYGEVARALGAPGAMRAVANACGANRVAVVIPCHRVIRESPGRSPQRAREFGGYRWGAARKAQLLTAEGVERAPGSR
jgi:AraC family transcriptional regulator of adaptative response/methylated-DNA-[protein]-cysteine methyltransferase